MRWWAARVDWPALAALGRFSGGVVIAASSVDGLGLGWPEVHVGTWPNLGWTLPSWM